MGGRLTVSVAALALAGCGGTTAVTATQTVTVTSWRELGSYMGYRVGITPAGKWQFFVAGD